MTSSTAALLGRLHVELPIIQAPMAGVSTPQLASAVSQAGALGSIAIGASTPAAAREAIAATRALTARPFNVNVFCHRPAAADRAREQAWLAHLRPHFEALDAAPPSELREIYKSFCADRTVLDMLLQERPAVASFHFGLPPAGWIAELRAAGVATLACATTLAEAQACEAAGVDAVVAQGMEAGGHRGVFEPERGDAQLGTFALVRQLALSCRLPVIAAGGIMDGAGIAAALALGAAGVQMGTAFVLCPESSADAAYRAALKSGRSHDTAITAAISGRPARGLANRMHREVGAAGAPSAPDYPTAYDAGKALAGAAAARGKADYAAHWAGQGAPLARELPAAELVAALAAEWRQAG